MVESNALMGVRQPEQRYTNETSTATNRHFRFVAVLVSYDVLVCQETVPLNGFISYS